jgi:hypothetical protein
MFEKKQACGDEDGCAEVDEGASKNRQSKKVRAGFPGGCFSQPCPEQSSWHFGIR